MPEGARAERTLDTVDDLTTRAMAGDRNALSRMVTLIEQGQTLDGPFGVQPDTWVLGVTGAPGVGKSTTVAELIAIASDEASRVAVIAVDPSSTVSGGALLGDRNRLLGVLDQHRQVFMRSLATRSQLGGLARSVPAVVGFLSSAGFDVVIVETAGVGQTEVDIMHVADTVLVLVSPEGGDWLQAAKSGVMEIGDIFGVSKADRDGAKAMASDIEAALSDRNLETDWKPLVRAFSSKTHEGFDELWTVLSQHRAHVSTKPRSRPLPLRSRAHQLVDMAFDGLERSEWSDPALGGPELLVALAECLRSSFGEYRGGSRES